MPAVSIIVPVYNVEAYLEQCVDSLIHQTLSDIEILLVNDGSTDGSGALAESLAKRDPRIRVFHKANGGLSDARNHALPRARGTYIGFVDSDDWVDHTMFQKLYAKAVATKAECVVCDAVKYQDGLGPVDKVGIRGTMADFGKSVRESPNIIYNSHSYAWNKLYHRKLFNDKKFHFPVGQLFEDSAVVYNLLAEANKVECINEQLYYYRVAREGAITSSVTPKIFDVFKSTKSIISYYEKNMLIRGKMAYVLERIVRNHIIARFDLLLNSNERRLTIRYVREAFRFLDARFPDWHKRYATPVSEQGSWRFACRKSLLLTYAWVLTPKWVFATYEYFSDLGFRKRNKVNPVPDHKLRDLQLELLEILDKFDKVCTKNRLRYYLSEGTLLGAVRHGGMIPWDDDIDVAMPRRDYRKLLTLPAEAWGEDIRLWSYLTDPRYPLPFSKVVTTKPSDFKNRWPADIPQKFSGPYIDIFPLDATRKHEGEERTELQTSIRRWRDLLLIKRGYKMHRSNANRWLILISPFYSFKYLHTAIRRASVASSLDVYADHLCNLASSYHPAKQTVPKSWYDVPIKLMFEGKERPVPAQFDALLKKIYGNYKTLPPVWKRGRRTHFLSYEPVLEAKAEEMAEPVKQAAE